MEMASALDKVLTSSAPLPILLEAAAAGSLPPANAMLALAHLGVVGAFIPEDRGGLGLALPDIALLAWIGGRRLMPTLARLEMTVLAPILAENSHPVDLLAETLIGEVVWACGQPGDLTIDQTIHDAKSTVWTQSGATHALIPCSDGALVVHMSADDAQVTPLPDIDPAQGKSQLIFPESAVRILHRANTEQVRHAADSTMLAELLGIADQVTTVTTSYTANRVQFGQPLFGFQAVRHTLANMRARTELVRSAVARSVVARAPLLVASLLSAATRSVRRVCEDAIQLHGGMGFTWELGLHLYYRRVLSGQMVYGGERGLATVIGHETIAGKT
jgi:alkylation response protein AidB-like acyl-CoA dehydrogenase